MTLRALGGGLGATDHGRAGRCDHGFGRLIGALDAGSPRAARAPGGRPRPRLPLVPAHPPLNRAGGPRRGAGTVARDGRRVRDPHPAHAQGIPPRAGRTARRSTTFRPRALGAEPPRDQPVALPGGRPRRSSGSRRRPARRRRGKLDRAPTLVVCPRDPADETSGRGGLLATADAAYIVLLAAHARGLAGYWRTPGCCARRRAARPWACRRRRAVRRAHPPRHSRSRTSRRRTASPPSPSSPISTDHALPRRRTQGSSRAETFDVVVIGGGITGAGVALDAASRGYSRRHRRARRLGHRHVEPVLEDGPRRAALPAELRPRAGPRGAAGAPADRAARPAPGVSDAVSRADARRGQAQ